MDFRPSQRGRKYGGFTPSTLDNRVLFEHTKASENHKINITRLNILSKYPELIYKWKNIIYAQRVST